MGCLGWSSLPLPFLSHLGMQHLTKHLIKTCYSLVLIWDIMKSMSCFIWSFQYISSFTSLLALVAWFTHLSGLACFSSFKSMVHSSVSKPSLGNSCWMVGFWNIFSIFWLNSSSGTGKTYLGSLCSSWSRVSPELMELVSSSRLDFASWPPFLLCSILELPVAGSCRTTSVGRALEGLNCQSLPPLLTAYWVHGQVDCWKHCNILMAFSKSRVLFTDSNPRAFFRIHTPGD